MLVLVPVLPTVRHARLALVLVYPSYCTAAAAVEMAQVEVVEPSMWFVMVVMPSAASSAVPVGRLRPLNHCPVHAWYPPLALAAAAARCCSHSPTLVLPNGAVPHPHHPAVAAATAATQPHVLAQPAVLGRTPAVAVVHCVPSVPVPHVLLPPVSAAAAAGVSSDHSLPDHSLCPCDHAANERVGWQRVPWRMRVVGCMDGAPVAVERWQCLVAGPPNCPE